MLPRLKYCCQLWSPTSVNQINAIENIQRKFTKYITGMHSLSYENRLKCLNLYSLQHRRDNLGWQSLDSQRQDQHLVLFFKIINGLSSVETEDIFTPADSCTRKNHSFKFKHLQANCDSYRYIFFSSHYFELEQPFIWH